MAMFIMRRVLSALFVVLSVATIVFFAMRLVPADPAEVVLGDQASAESIAAFRKQAGLDRPLLVQYQEFVVGLLHGDLGRSLVTGASIGKQIGDLFPYTISLALGSLLIGVLVGVPTGVLTAVRRNSWVDFGGRILALFGFSFPAFYLGIVLLLIFSVWLGWFPVIHTPRGSSLVEHVQKLVLPSFSLGIVQAAYITRLTRSTMLETLGQDFVRTAVAKGLKPSKVYFKHALRNALIPVVTATALYTGTILGGAILTETVFNRPGLGKLLVGAIAQRDYNLIQSGLIVFAVMITLVNLLVDLSYGLLDPRVKNA
ncbi:ABC transporter permease [Ensifer aridi]|uniref:ABC transporter permease n=1 Tax=Ensifer aridi TaxID=1708715 RepID=UPI000A0FEB5F|nr:ABC transporter permease [Ensifer aridi]